MKQFISALLLIGCLVACDPDPDPDQGLIKNSVTVLTSDSTDQSSDEFVFSVYPDVIVNTDKTSIVIFPPKEQVENGDWRDQFEFKTTYIPPMIEIPSPEKPENQQQFKIEIAMVFLKKKFELCRLQYFQYAEDLNHYTNEAPEEMVVGVYSKKYPTSNIRLKCRIRRESWKPRKTMVNRN